MVLHRVYIKMYRFINAFHVYLPEGMRLVYSVTIYRGEKAAFLMELTDHHTYERRFNY